MAASSAQYVIDVAVDMPAGEATAAQLDQLSKLLVASGASADDFHDAIAQASNALAAAKQASVGANQALSAGNAIYKDLEQAALQASKAQEKAAKLGVVPPNVAATTEAATAAVNAYASKLAGLESAAKTAAADESKLAKELDQVKQASSVGTKALAESAAASEEHTVSTRALSRGLSELGGPLGQLGRTVLTPIRGFQALAQEIGGSNALMAVAAIGTVALVAAIIAATAALAYAVVKIASWAIGLADATRSANLHEQALSKINSRYAAVADDLDAITTSTGQSREQLDALTKTLVDARISAANMPAALKAAALAEAALGSGGATQFIDRIKAGTLTVKAFAAQSQASFGGIVAQQMLGLDAQTATFHANIAKLFGGLNIDPALKGLQKLVALFDENSAAGSAIKLLFGKVFQPLIDQAENAATVVEAFVLGFLIGLTKLYIFVKPAIKAVSEFFGFKDASLSSTLALVTKAAEYLAPVIAIMVAGFAAAIVVVGVVVGVITAVQFAILAIPAALLAAAVALTGVFLNAWHSVTAFLSGINLAQVGSDIIQGLANGLLAAGPAVLHAITGVVGGAIDSAKHLLGIASPSKVFGEIGVNTVAGFTNEIDAGAGEAQASIASMVAPPDDAGQSPLARQTAQTAPRIFGGGGGAQSAGGSSSSNSKSISLTGPFIFNGVTGVDDIEARFGELLTRVIEGDATQIGATPEAA